VALVLAIEPDLQQAEILTRIVREKVKAEVVIVDSRDAALEAMRSAVPDVMLLSALLSPRDEDELVAHLRTLESAEHLQTHTIPQLAAAATGPSGPARGLLKAFRRKKDATPVSGCDPDLFAQEIRVFLDQAEQKRRERAENRQYRPVGAALSGKPFVAPDANAPQEEPASSAATTSWDSPFEWRKSDTGPAPLVSYQEDPEAAPFTFEAPEQPAGEADFNWSAHLLDSSAPGREAVEPAHEAAAPLLTDEVIAPDHLLEAHDETAPEALDAQEQIDTPELFETFVPPPLKQEPFTEESTPVVEAVAPVVAVAPVMEAVAPVEDVVESVAPVDDLLQLVAPIEDLVDAVAPVEYGIATSSDQAIATPEEIEAYGRIEISGVLQTADEEPFAIECSFDAEPTLEQTQEPMAGMIATEHHAEVVEEEEIDLTRSLDDAVIAVEDDSVFFDASDEDAIAAAADAPEAPAARKAPVNLGPLATWARLERKSEEERKPGSDMREIIERLAVPPHIAGVSYARGVRIRRVRVAGVRDRKRPADQTGPVILSRRALAESRSLRA
jgi:CheY-like chemotaxis protein